MIDMLLIDWDKVLWYSSSIVILYKTYLLNQYSFCHTHLAHLISWIAILRYLLFSYPIPFIVTASYEKPIIDINALRINSGNEWVYPH